MRKALVIILVSALLLSPLMSCTYHSVHLLDEEELEWMDAYNHGDTVLFHSDEGIDTMIVARVVRNTPSREGINCFSVYYANGEFDNKILHKGRVYECGFIVHTILQDSTGLVFFFDKRISYNKLSPDDFEVLEQDGVMYDDVFIIDNRYSHVADSFEEVCEYFVWSKSKGLLQYKYLNGEVYTYYKKLPRKK